MLFLIKVVKFDNDMDVDGNMLSIEFKKHSAKQYLLADLVVRQNQAIVRKLRRQNLTQMTYK